MTTAKKVFAAVAVLLLVPIVATMVAPMLLLMAPIGLLSMPLFAGALANGLPGGTQPPERDASSRATPAKDYMTPIVLPQPHQGWWPTLSPQD